VVVESIHANVAVVTVLNFLCFENTTTLAKVGIIFVVNIVWDGVSCAADAWVQEECCYISEEFNAC